MIGPAEPQTRWLAMVRRSLDKDLERKMDLLGWPLGAPELKVMHAYLLEALLERAAKPHLVMELDLLNGLLRKVTRKRLDALAKERRLTAVDWVDPL